MSAAAASSTPISPLLAVKGLARRFGDHVAVDGLSFEVGRAEVFGLLGPNGAGKSTTFHLLTGLQHADAGEFLWEGASVSPLDGALRAKIGVAFQKPSVDGKLTARENLVLGARLYCVPAAQAKGRIAEALEKVGLTERADDPVEEFSGGMRRRLELARVLLGRPRLLILDEPTQGLDQGAFRSFWKDLLALRKEEGLTILLTTHYPEEAEFCDRIGVMDHGKLIACDSPNALRAEVGGDVIAVKAADLEELSGAIASKFQVRPVIVGEELHFEHEKAHQLIPRLVEAFPAGRFESVTIHRPTLADVFIRLTGRSLEEEGTPPAEEAA